MSSTDDIGILGHGHAVPSKIRRNEDPLFVDRSSLGDSPLFYGFRERRVLAADERVESLGILAARAALVDAAVEAGAIDRLYGAVSPSEHLVPSGLFAVHAELGLRRDATVVPIQSDYTNFVAALTAAWEAIAAGRCKLALVVVAAGWSRVVDYASPGAIGIGDGAAAVVVGRGSRLCFVDELGEVHGEHREAMTVQLRRPTRGLPGEGDEPRPTFVFEAAASRLYRELGVAVPLRLFTELLSRHRIAAADVALVTHQSSRGALDAWQKELAPCELPSVLETLGNCTLATAAITLSLYARELRSRYVVVMTFGCGQNFSAMLLRRS